MSYRSLEKVHERYQLTVMWLLIGAFVAAWAMMFVHPSVTLLLFWSGLIVVGVFAIIQARLVKAERHAAKTALKSHTCPRCDAHVHLDLEKAGAWHCDECGATFLATGDLQRAGR